MAKFKKILALILAVCVVCTVAVMSTSAATVDNDGNTSASSSIKVHYYTRTAHLQFIIGTAFRRIFQQTIPVKL